MPTETPIQPTKRPRGRPKKPILPPNTIDTSSLISALNKPTDTPSSTTKAPSKPSTTTKSPSKAIKQALNFYTLSPVDLNIPLEVKGRIDWYFLYCSKHEVRPSVSSLCLALKVNRSTFMSWVAGRSRSYLQEVANSALSLIQAVWEDMLADGKINPIPGLFLGKNDFGYVDTSEVKVEVAPERKTREQLIAESKMIPGIAPQDDNQNPKLPPLKGEGTVD